MLSCIKVGYGTGTCQYKKHRIQLGITQASARSRLPRRRRPLASGMWRYSLLVIRYTLFVIRYPLLVILQVRISDLRSLVLNSLLHAQSHIRNPKSSIRVPRYILSDMPPSGMIIFLGATCWKHDPNSRSPWNQSRWNSLHRESRSARLGTWPMLLNWEWLAGGSPSCSGTSLFALGMR